MTTNIIKMTKKYIVSIVFFLHLIFNAICSHWVQEVYPMPLIIQRLLTVFIYLPYLFVIFIKFILDIKEKCFFSKINVLYYSFCVYFVFVSFWRYFCHLEVKESLYCFIVLLGGLAFVILNNRIEVCNKECRINNVIICTILLCVFRVVFFILVNKTFSYSPINDIVFACVFIISIPYLVYLIDNKKIINTFVCSFLLFLSFVFVLLSGSRSSFFMLLYVVFMIILIMILKYKKHIFSFCSLLMISIIFVGFLFAVNFKFVRKNVIREVWFLNSIIRVEDFVDDANEPVENNNNNNNIDELIDQQNQQIDRSDTGRKALMLYGINEIKKSPLLGTGDVMYEQQMTETYIANQSSHNFIIESLVSFGMIGFTIMAAIILHIFYRGFKTIDSKSKYYLFLILSVFLAFSFIQPLFYNAITFYYLMIICSAFFGIENKV